MKMQKYLKAFLLTFLLCLAFAGSTTMALAAGAVPGSAVPGSAVSGSAAPENSAPATASVPGADARPVVSGYKQMRVNVAFTEPQGQAGPKETMRQALSTNMEALPFAVIIPGNSIPGGVNLEPRSAEDLKRFQMAGVDVLITSKWVAPDKVELRAFQPYSGENFAGGVYTAGSNEAVYAAADRFCSSVLERLIGDGSFFRATLAFVKSNGQRQRDIWTVRPTGRGLRQLSTIKGESLSPSWSRDGRMLAFSNIEPRSHGLCIWNAATNQVTRQRFPGSVIAPCFLPDGRIAVTLTDQGKQDIYLVNTSMQREGVLVSGGGTNVSPSVDASGSRMVFTSSRTGGTQVHMQDLRTGSVRQISTVGSYNSDPSISPDGKYVVYCRMMGNGHQIIVHELESGREAQLTNEGSNEQPEFAPDSYFIAFMSTRSGGKKIYLTTRMGGQAKEIPTGGGDAAMPDWGLF